MSEEMSILETEHPITHVEPVKKRFGFYLKLLLLLFTFVALGLIAAGSTLLSLNNPPASFPVNEPVVITPGTQVRAITEQLKAEGVVQSQQLLYYVLVFMHDPADLKASTYVFDEPLDTLAVARRLTEGDFDTDLIRLTHIEGESVALLANRADSLLPDFDEEYFVTEAQQHEGKLYPETYFIPVTYTASELLALMLETYTETTQSLRPAFASSTLSEDEVIILASILEREANSPESMGIVSGILQNRLAIDMPLQADATIEYVIETPLGELPPGQLAAELRELDSPYNTYLYTGLPPTPIGNPGLEAITAALQPTESDYFYYVTGNDGEFYYAETYNQHLQNIELHLR
jgi:UPF0755 protein